MKTTLLFALLYFSDRVVGEGGGVGPVLWSVILARPEKWPKWALSFITPITSLPCHDQLQLEFERLLPGIRELPHLNSAGEIALFLPRGR